MEIMETLHFVEKNSTLWHTLWAKLWEQNGKPLDEYGVPDFSEYNPQYNEMWQYMGTVDKGSNQQEHQFRHRAHPSNNERKYISIII
jgi:hypothetical protein